jgi:Protein of unknown function (DUF4238)
MTDPRRHHYVPQFHQRRFADADGRLWVWDKATDRVFRTTPGSIAVETDFYRLHEFERLGHDPFAMEKQLSAMESDMYRITEQWLGWLRTIDPGQQIEIPESNRTVASQFIAVQFLRTADARAILSAVHAADHPDKLLSEEERTGLHTELMWDIAAVDTIAGFIKEAIWIFARNRTSVPFCTSDNPLTFRTKDNSMWLKVGFLEEGNYAVYPLAPDIVLFCHEGKFWNRMKSLNDRLSPVLMTPEMVESENSGQVFMASRFVISPVDDFAFARDFARTIGTDTYASS